jgi:CRISPR-associated protein Cmr3
MPIYQITITPLEYYFFGGEKHNADLKTNYFVESLPYPQQTALLGLLRYFLLQKKGLIDGKFISNKAEAAILIGEHSFHFLQQQKFGKITKISPLYFRKKAENYFFAPLDIAFEMENFVLKKGNKPFNAKDHSTLIQQYLISENSQEVIPISKIAMDFAQVGNEKGEKGKTKENAFYKQKMKYLEKDWSFAVDAEIAEEIEHKDYYCSLGGEKCHFKLNFVKKDAFFAPKYPKKHQREGIFCLLCLSDCFIDSVEIKNLPFAVNEYVSFRNLRSKVSTKNFYALKKVQDNKDEHSTMDNGLIHSSRYQLLQRGSVLYFEKQSEAEKLRDIIEKENGKTIGFNRILTSF